MLFHLLLIISVVIKTPQEFLTFFNLLVNTSSYE